MRKIFECKITVEGMFLSISKIAEAFIKDGCEVVERPLEFDNYRNCTKAELEIYRVVKSNK